MPQPVADRAALLDCGVHPAGRVVAEGGEHLFTAGGVKRRRPVAVSPQSRGSTSDSVQLLTASRKRSVAPSQERGRTEPARR